MHTAYQRTEGLRRQSQDIIQQAYDRGYKDGKVDAKEEMTKTQKENELQHKADALVKAIEDVVEAAKFGDAVNIIKDANARVFGDVAEGFYREALEQWTQEEKEK